MVSLPLSSSVSECGVCPNAVSRVSSFHDRKVDCGSVLQEGDLADVTSVGICSREGVVHSATDRLVFSIGKVTLSASKPVHVYRCDHVF